MFSLHLPRSLVPIRQSFSGIDLKALLVLMLALVSGILIVAGFVAAA